MRRARPLLAAAVRDVGVRAGNRLSGGGSGLPALQMPGEQEEGCLATLAPGSSGPLPRLRCDGHNHRGSCRANHRHCGSLARGVLWPSATAYGQCRNIGATSTSPRLASPTTSPLHPLGVVPRHTPAFKSARPLSPALATHLLQPQPNSQEITPTTHNDALFLSCPLRIPS